MAIKYWQEISFLAIFGSILYFGAQNYMEEPESDCSCDPEKEDPRHQARVKNIGWAMIAIFIVFCWHRTWKPNMYELFKPYERIWRFLREFMNAYLYILIFVYFMNPYDARKMWSFVESRLGKPVTKEYHTYDDDCEVTWYNIVDNMDHYFLAHFTNWFLAAVILRDAPLLHFWSILDEILELSAQHRLPHFRECWWDHVFHDVLITNTPGIILGLKFCDFLGLKKYDWLGRKGAKSISEWRVWHDHFRFGGIFQLYFLISANFLTGFFMINALWIPPLSIPTVTRMYIWFLIGNISFKEGYEIAEARSNPETHFDHKESPNRWITYGIVVMEIAISLKYERNAGNLTYEQDMPAVAFYGWLLFFIAYLSYYLYLKYIRDTDKEFRESIQATRRTPRKSSSKKNR